MAENIFWPCRLHSEHMKLPYIKLGCYFSRSVLSSVSASDSTALDANRTVAIPAMRYFKMWPGANLPLFAFKMYTWTTESQPAPVINVFKGVLGILSHN